MKRFGLRSLGRLIKETAKSAAMDDVPSMAAALAYHATLSLAPLLIILVSAASMIFGVNAVENDIVAGLKEAFGEKAALAVQSVIHSTQTSLSGTLALQGSSFVLMVIFSTGVFQQLIGSLNTIWGLDRDHKRTVTRGLLRVIRRHLLAFLMVIALTMALYFSLFMKTLRFTPPRFMTESIPEFSILAPRIPLILSPLILMFLFAALFKFLPHAKIKWHDVWLGSAVTAVLFVITEKLIALYLQKTIVTSLYGAAGSLIILLLWIYWSAMVFLFGAEMAKVYAGLFGSRKEIYQSPDPEEKCNG